MPEEAAIAALFGLGAEAEPRLQVDGRVKHPLAGAGGERARQKDGCAAGDAKGCLAFDFKRGGTMYKGTIIIKGGQKKKEHRTTSRRRAGFQIAEDHSMRMYMAHRAAQQWGRE